MQEMLERLNRARNGGAILFCGAGFSADCLNFNPDEALGTGAQLLALFNQELGQQPPYKDLKNAAEALWERRADHGMLNLLKNHFTVAEITADLANILRYPWEAVYTTNYDNAIELAAQEAKKPIEAINNTDDLPNESNMLSVIHLHGYVNKWDIHNIRESCVLTADSYMKLTQVHRWIDRFRSDAAKAQIVVFVGFNANDFHLNQAIYDLTGLREKAFFINRPTAKADPDVKAGQERLGIPLYFGHKGLAKKIDGLLLEDAPEEPNVASFKVVQPLNPAQEVPAAEEIENLFIFGETDPQQFARDMANGVSQYHIRRHAIDEALESIKVGSRILLFTGYPCDGKSILVDDLAQRLSGARTVYKLVMPYESLLKEVANILHHADDSALVIENCFDLRTDWLQSIARLRTY